MLMVSPSWFVRLKSGALTPSGMRAPWKPAVAAGSSPSASRRLAAKAIAPRAKTAMRNRVISTRGFTGSGG